MAVTRDIDPRLIERGMQVIDGKPASNGKVWRLVKARWFDQHESGGRHHIYVESIDEGGILVDGMRFVVNWPTGATAQTTKRGRDFDAANFPMSASRNEFSVVVPDGDTVRGLGMGQMTPNGYNPGIHTATLLTFQLKRANVTPPPVVTPPPNKPVSHIQVIVDDVMVFDNWSAQ